MNPRDPEESDFKLPKTRRKAISSDISQQNITKSKIYSSNLLMLSLFAYFIVLLFMYLKIVSLESIINLQKNQISNLEKIVITGENSNNKIIISLVKRVEILEKKWYRINDLLGKIDITNYIRHFWNSRNSPAERKATLFKTIKKKVDSYELSIQLINALDESVLVYAALINPDSEVWVGGQSKLINEINILEVTQCFPLLMVAKQKLNEDEFTKLLRDVVALSFRYNTIGGQNPNELERVYGRASAAVFRGEINSAKDVYSKYLKDVYLDDNSFKNDFKNKQINTNKYKELVKYILSKLEKQYGGIEAELTNKDLTIEHILPENPDDNWVSQFANTDAQEYIFRLGNLTLLESAKNRESDRKLFDEKQTIYQTSNYRLSKEQTNYSIWNVASISNRQSDMANKALTIWKINYA